jgi:hypothetical protein
MTLVGGSLVADRSRWAAAEPPPETTRIKLNKFPVYGNCLAPLYAAEELM